MLRSFLFGKQKPNIVRRIILILLIFFNKFYFFLGLNINGILFNLNLYFLLISVSIPLLILTGQYRAITRYIDNQFLYLISLRIFSRY